MSETPHTLDLRVLPPYRRPRVSEAYWREVAAERIREVCPAMKARYVNAAAYRETALRLRRERAEWGRGGVAEVTARYVRRVMEEQR